MDWSRFDAVLFDLDGVLTPTAEVHMRAWQEMFQGYLAEHAPDTRPYTDADYFAYVDGKPRYDGVRDFLISRGIELPQGDPSDAAEAETVCGLGNRKNEVFSRVLERDGVQPYPGSLRFLDALDGLAGHPVQIAVVSSSRNAPAVLEAAGLAQRFDVVVDGKVAADGHLPGKPAPDTFLEGARRLGVEASGAVVFEDAVSGVRAGHAGEFGAVVGVNRGVGEGALRDAGADIVVNDLSDLVDGAPE